MGFSIKRKEVNLEEFLTMIENKTEVIEKIDLTKIFKINDLKIKDLTFFNCSFPRELKDIEFIGCDFDFIDFSFCFLVNVTFNNCTFVNCNFFQSVFKSSSFSEPNGILSSNFLSAKFIDTDLGKYGTDGKNSFLELQCPEEGSFIGYKKIVDKNGKYICKLLIPEDAKRSSATSRKCRCSKAKVLEITNIKTGEKVGKVSHINPYTVIIYQTGEIVYPDKWDDNRFNECSHGIHFFITKKEALDY